VDFDSLAMVRSYLWIDPKTPDRVIEFRKAVSRRDHRDSGAA
jgi:hypothetical protein